jgi:lysozyme
MKPLLLFVLFASSPFIGAGCHHVLKQLPEPEPLDCDRITIPVEQLGQHVSPTALCMEPIDEAPALEVSEKESNQLVLDMIKRYEGFSSTVYRCPAGYLTIGYGFTEAKYLRMKRLTRAQADRILEHEMLPKMKELIARYVKVPLHPFQEAALVSFTFNLGEESLERIVSESRNRLNAGNYKVIPTLLKMYTKAKVNGKTRTLQGLVARRNEEAKLFSGDTL